MDVLNLIRIINFLPASSIINFLPTSSILCFLVSINDGTIPPVTEDFSLSVILRSFLNFLWHTKWIHMIILCYSVTWCCLFLFPFWSANPDTDPSLHKFILSQNLNPASPIPAISNKLIARASLLIAAFHISLKRLGQINGNIYSIGLMPHLYPEHHHKMRHFMLGDSSGHLRYIPLCINILFSLFITSMSSGKWS